MGISLFSSESPSRGQITAPTWRNKEQKALGDPANRRARCQKQVLSLSPGWCCQPRLFAGSVLHTVTSTDAQASEEKTGIRDASRRVGRKRSHLQLLMETAKSPTSWHFGFSGKDTLSWRKIKAVFRICANDFTNLVEWRRLPPHLNIWFQRATRVC